MNPLNVAQALDAAVLCAHARIPVQLLGSPGVGKSAVPHYMAAHFNLPCQIYNLPLWVDASDGRGLPDFSPRDETGRRQTYYATPVHLPTQPTVFGLDELTAASTSVKLLMYDFLLGGRIGEYTVPVGSIIIATGNAREHGAGATAANSALDNRLCHLAVAATIDAIEEWSLGTNETRCALPSIDPYPCGATGLPTRLLPSHAVSGRLHPLILAFLRRRPALLDTFSTRTLGEPAYATPRTWEMASRTLRAAEALASLVSEAATPSSSLSSAPNGAPATPSSSLSSAPNGAPATHPTPPTAEQSSALQQARSNVLAGLLGHGVALELIAYLDHLTSMPDPAEIDTDYASAPVPTDPAVLYALTALLAHTLTPDNAEARLRYGVRLPAEFGMLFHADADKRHTRLLRQCPAYITGGLQLHYMAMGCKVW